MNQILDSTVNLYEVMHEKRSLSFFPLQAISQASPSGDVGETLEDLQQQNQLQSLASSTQPSQRPRCRSWSHVVLPKPEPEEEPEPFILDLRNFPELANADLGSHSPNIQVET
jgi:hypothetical protein